MAELNGKGCCFNDLLLICVVPYISDSEGPRTVQLLVVYLRYANSFGNMYNHILRKKVLANNLDQIANGSISYSFPPDIVGAA